MPRSHYSEADRERAYYAWRDNGQSSSEAAKAVGVKERTLQMWKNNGNWRDRLAQEASVVITNETKIARAKMAGILGDGVERLHTIIKDGSDRDAVAAVNLLLRYTTGITDTNTNLTMVSIKEIASWRDKTPEELAAIASSSLSANVESSMEARYQVKQ